MYIIYTVSLFHTNIYCFYKLYFLFLYFAYNGDFIVSQLNILDIFFNNYFYGLQLIAESYYNSNSTER